MPAALLLVAGSSFAAWDVPARDGPAPPRRVASKNGRVAIYCDRAEWVGLRPVNTERAETRRHGEFQELGYTHPCNVPPDFIVPAKVNGRVALVATDGGGTPTEYGRDKRVPPARPLEALPCA